MANSNRPNIRLTDTQLVLLSAAAQRDDGLLIPPETIQGPALATALRALLKRGLVEAVGAEHDQLGSAASNGAHLARGKITRAGLDALGIAPEGDPEPAPDGVAKHRVAPKRTKAQPAPAEGSQLAELDSITPGPARAAMRRATKQARVIALLSREHGATLDELIAETGWLPHTTRAALTGLRHKGYALERSKDANGRTVYRIRHADQHAPAPAGSDRKA